MPEDGSKLTDVAVLADRSGRVELVVPIADLTRLRPLLAAANGVATGRIAFSRDRGHIVASVSVSAPLELICQRCLGRFSLPVHGESQVALVANEVDVGHVPEDLESVLAPEGRIRLRELVEEELLLALPGAPRHRQGECGAEAADVAATPSPEPTQRPFAALGDLLGGGGAKK